VGFAALSRSRAQAAVPADGRFVRVNGKRVHYRDVGSGPTIVMIHGLAGQMRNFSYALLDKLASDHRVILIDRPGSGYSDPIDSATIRSQAAHIGDALQTLGLDRPLVVGHSLGGAVALALALDRPDQVGGLALLAPLTHPMDEVSEAFDGLAIASPTARLAVAWTLATPMMMLRGEKGAQAAFAPEPVPGDFATRGGGALLARPGNFQAASADLNAAPADLPVSVLFGRDDPVLDPEAQGEAFVAAVPEADLTLIGGGHMIPVTQPDTVADWIRERAIDFRSERPE
jgi:pimeloyl-ACP methyl ester carboxylesterase